MWGENFQDRISKTRDGRKTEPLLKYKNDIEFKYRTLKRKLHKKRKA
jgi:hypothetical protein